MAASMVCACIDIGSNTTRVLVAEVVDGRLAEVVQRRAFTRMGADLRAHGRISRAKLDEVAAVVGEYRAHAAQLGAEQVGAVATAVVRAAANAHELLEAVRVRAHVEVEVLDAGREALLAFSGAVSTAPGAPDGTVAVLDVGGGSTEIAVGRAGTGVSWWTSLALGSGLLTEAHVASDPPTRAELEAMRARAREILDVHMPDVDCALAVGGSAASLRRLLGPRPDAGRMRSALARLLAAGSGPVGAELGLDPQRVQLLPAGILILEAAARRLGCRLELGVGGIREGICLELAAGAAPAPG